MQANVSYPGLSQEPAFSATPIRERPNLKLRSKVASCSTHLPKASKSVRPRVSATVASSSNETDMMINRTVDIHGYISSGNQYGSTFCGREPISTSPSLLSTNDMFIATPAPLVTAPVTCESAFNEAYRSIQALDTGTSIATAIVLENSPACENITDTETW